MLTTYYTARLYYLIKNCISYTLIGTCFTYCVESYGLKDFFPRCLDYKPGQKSWLFTCSCPFERQPQKIRRSMYPSLTSPSIVKRQTQTQSCLVEHWSQAKNVPILFVQDWRNLSMVMMSCARKLWPFIIPSKWSVLFQHHCLIAQAGTHRSSCKMLQRYCKVQLTCQCILRLPDSFFASHQSRILRTHVHLLDVQILNVLQ